MAAASQLACGRADRHANEANQPAADARSASRGDAAADDLRVNLTGCMERGAIPGSFVLTHVSTAANGSVGTEGTTGTSGSTASGGHSAAVAGATGDTYTVMSGDRSDLGKYVGKRVTVTGRFAPPSNQSAAGMTGSSGTTAGSDASGDAHARVPSGAAARDGDSTAARSGPGTLPTRLLTTSEVREVAGSCTPGSR